MHVHSGHTITTGTTNQSHTSLLTEGAKVQPRCAPCLCQNPHSPPSMTKQYHPIQPVDAWCLTPAPCQVTMAAYAYCHMPSRRRQATAHKVRCVPAATSAATTGESQPWQLVISSSGITSQASRSVGRLLYAATSSLPASSSSLGGSTQRPLSLMSWISSSHACSMGMARLTTSLPTYRSILPGAPPT